MTAHRGLGGDFTVADTHGGRCRLGSETITPRQGMGDDASVVVGSRRSNLRRYGNNESEFETGALMEDKGSVTRSTRLDSSSSYNSTTGIAKHNRRRSSDSSSGGSFASRLLGSLVHPRRKTNSSSTTTTICNTVAAGATAGMVSSPLGGQISRSRSRSHTRQPTDSPNIYMSIPEEQET